MNPIPKPMNKTKTHKNIEWHATAEESHFSWSSCDCCGSRLGGDRWDAEKFGWNIEKKKLELLDSGAICVDCLTAGA